MSALPPYAQRAGTIPCILVAFTPHCSRSRYENGVFRCGQLNVLVALRDVAAGDGPTMVVPGAHKSNFPILSPVITLAAVARMTFPVLSRCF